MEKKGLRVNIKKTKFMCSGRGQGIQKDSGKYPCAVCRIFTYFGHAMRHQNCTLMRDVLLGKTQGKRGRGRPKMSYLRNLSEWSQRSPSEVLHATEDRDGWKSIVRGAARAASNYVDAVQ